MNDNNEEVNKPDTIEGAIEDLKVKQQERLNLIANSDPIYCNLAGQIHALLAVQNKDVT